MHRCARAAAAAAAACSPRQLCSGPPPPPPHLPLPGWFQLASALEIAHAALGLVGGSPLTALMQWAGRSNVLFGVVAAVPEVQNRPAVGAMFLAWALSEVIRYPWYAASLAGACPQWLTWLRCGWQGARGWGAGWAALLFASAEGLPMRLVGQPSPAASLSHPSHSPSSAVWPGSIAPAHDQRDAWGHPALHTLHARGKALRAGESGCAKPMRPGAPPFSPYIAGTPPSSGSIRWASSGR